MNNKKINTVLFDFDGTLIDTNDIIIESFQHTFKTVIGEEKPVEEIIKTFGEPLGLTMEKMLDIDPNEAIRIYRSYHNQKFEDLIKIFPGMLELVKELYERGYKLAIVTSRLRNTTLIGLRKFDIEKYFSYVLTADDTEKHKPDPAAINIVLEKLNSTPDEAIMIGDSKFDIMCANNAGVKSILVGWAISLSEEEIEGIYKPTYIAEKAEDVLRILD
jgi:pyrophosphatase PpaX